MSENKIDELVKELANDSTELRHYVVMYGNEDMSDEEIDDLVEDLAGDPLSLREFVINALED